MRQNSRELGPDVMRCLSDKGSDGDGRPVALRHCPTGLFPEMLTLDAGGTATDLPDAPTRLESLLTDLDAKLGESIGLWPWPHG